MKQQKQSIWISTLIFCALLISSAMTSCDNVIYDGLDPCPQGVRLRFVYDYNMEFANSFHKKVDCVTLYVYDEKGNYLKTITETTDVLADENYRMTLDFEPGHYRLVAYGGLACEEHSFSVADEPSRQASAYTDLQVRMDEGELGTKLHDFYYGMQDVEIRSTDTDYVEKTLNMMKNTNNIRIVLQQLDGEPVDDKDFSFFITDDNTLFAYDNMLKPNGTVTYTPWVKGQASTGVIVGENGVEEQEVIVAFAELSTSRLMTHTSPRLIIKRNDTGADIVNIPLNNYLLLLKSMQYADMGSQEFLDRESDWSMIFFLDHGHRWINTYFVINDWVVRINETEF